MSSTQQWTVFAFISRLWTDRDYQRLWLSRLATSLAIVVAWHFWDRRQPDGAAVPKEADKRRRPKRQGRLVLLSPEVLPDDLVLEVVETTTTNEAATIKYELTDGDASEVLETTVQPPPDTKEPADGTGAEGSASSNRTERNQASSSAFRNSRRSRPRSSLHGSSSNTSATTRAPPPFLTADPSLEALWYWCDTEASLFRIYTIATRQCSEDSDSSFSAVPPYNPSSRRGNVRVSLQVTNHLPFTVHVAWIDYKGRHVPKGTIRSRETWHQTTWIDHPWVFSHATGYVLLHYVPYRIIPTTSLSPTIMDDDTDVGVHRFTLKPATQLLSSNDDDDHQETACCVDDPILPYPARHFLSTSQLALEWALHHALRMQFDDWDLLLQYCHNLLLHPEDHDKYRSIRLANPQFGPRLWQTTAQGVLLAIGFYVNQGYAQIGGPSSSSSSLVKDLSRSVQVIEQWRQCALQEQGQEQPVGADGFGRAGYGRAGAINTEPM